MAQYNPPYYVEFSPSGPVHFADTISEARNIAQSAPADYPEVLIRKTGSGEVLHRFGRPYRYSLGHAHGATRQRGRYGATAQAHYADPGYLADRKPRYPLNTVGRIRNAAARFAQNAWRYTRDQQRRIAARIGAAERRHGVHGEFAGETRQRPRLSLREAWREGLGHAHRHGRGLLRSGSRSARRAGRR